jgi:hypothetical protein
MVYPGDGSERRTQNETQQIVNYARIDDVT